MSIRRLLVVVAIALIAAACSGTTKPMASKAFCLAADKYNNEIDRTMGTGKIDARRQAELADALARTAPKKIKQDAEIFANALHRVQTDPSFKKDDPKIRTAADNVLRLANQACGVYNRTGGI
jgi:hypothetical protein